MSQFRGKRNISSISNVAFHFATILLLPVSPLASVSSDVISTKCDFYFIFTLLWLGARVLTPRVHISLRAGQPPSKESRCGWCVKPLKFMGHSALLMFFWTYIENLNKGNTSLKEFHTYGFFWPLAILA